ncbi:MAG: type II toxin-antitoxin system Phd/YefM family antitoxin [Anaerolineae bacterium]|nr:type II toxin-antitoxin system Phd/YefM family antitoxin [Anaerolineae bacterium]
MPKRYSIAEARNNLAAIVHDVERSALVELTRRGEPVAVLLSMQEYKRLLPRKTGFWQAYMAFRDTTDLQELRIEPEVFAGLRDSSPGREVNW